MNDFTRKGKAQIKVLGRIWRNNETPGSGEQYGLGGWTLRNCTEYNQHAQSWLVFGMTSRYGKSPEDCVEQLNEIAAACLKVQAK
jgi:hypothetical protein